MGPLLVEYPISVLILYFSGETEDLVDTMEAVTGLKNALEDRGHKVRVSEVNRKNWKRAANLPGDVVINLVEDPTWELYIKVGTYLEKNCRAQFGHDMHSFRYVTKKAKVKRRMQKLGIPSPRFRVFNRRSRILRVRGLRYPLIVKPSGQHAGIGISQASVVKNQKGLTARVRYLFDNLPGEVIAEEYIEGREIHVTVIGNNRHVVSLPVCEIIFGGNFEKNWSVYTYEAKWGKGSWEYEEARAHAPAELNTLTASRVERAVIKAYRAFKCRDAARMDVRLDKKGKAYIVDVNMNPSLNRFDDQDATVKSVEALGWNYEEFIETLVGIAYRRVHGRLPDRIRERQFMLAAPKIL